VPEPTRRESREQRRRRFHRRQNVALAIVLAVLIGGVSAVAVALGNRADEQHAAPPSTVTAVAYPAATSIPVPEVSAAPVVIVGVCDDPAVSAALASGSDADVITAVGGGEAFRGAVAAGTAPCLSLDDPGRSWVVVNKLRPLAPLDFSPASVVAPRDLQRTVDGRLRPEVAEALTSLVAAAGEEGAGEIGLNSAYRSYESQQRIYGGYVASLGEAAADLTSARPGYSEHQTGLATDVMACDGGCGSIEAFGGTAQSAWVVENAWRFGFVVRYEEGATGTTGYEAEPWHLRYIGPQLAQAYRDGGFHTLEDFFGLPPAPAYK
jgi:D-alanyl-D-alanine carboxypeptidase